MVNNNRKTYLNLILLFTIINLSCGFFGQSIDQNNNNSQVDAELPDSPVKDIPAVEDTVPGPSILDLDDPSLYQYRDKNFSTHLRIEFEGDSSGFVDISGDWFAGSPSNYRFTFDTTLPLWEGVVPFTYNGVNDAVYLVAPYGCSDETGEVENPFDEAIFIGNYLTGEAPLAENGIMVNGTVVDRYDITQMNVLDNEESAIFDFSFVDSSGSVYVDRISQVIVRIEQAGTGIDTNIENEGAQAINLTIRIDFLLNNNIAAVVLPEACESGEPGAISEDSGGVPTDIPFPIMDDARNISAQSGIGIYGYDTLYDFDEIVSFYKEEMTALGFSLDSDLVAAPSALLQFSNDQGTVIVTVGENEDAAGFFVSFIDNTSP